MTKNKPLFIIVFFLSISILIAIYFQYSLVKKVYIEKKQLLEYEFVDIIEHSLYLIEKERGNVKFSHDEFHDIISSYIIKSSGDYYYYEMNEEELVEYFESIKNGITELEINLNKDDFNDVKRFVDLTIAERKLKMKYEIDYIENLSYTLYRSQFNKSDLIITYPFGAFGISIHNGSSLFSPEMIKIILFSLFFILTITFCGFLLVKKYLNEKRLSVYKNEFINNLTHELQTPLTVSKLALEKLSIDLADDKKSNKYVNIVEKENSKIELLTKRILKLAELKTVVSVKEKINVSEAIKDIIFRYKPLIKDDDIILTDLNHLEFNLHGNKTLFLDMLDNLLSNAIKYSTSPRSIIIKTNIKNRKLHLSIKDNGIGIPKEFEDKIFSPFFKVPKNNTHEIKSHGLGLSYVAQIIKQMEGEITMSSELNKGTTFNIILPYEN